MISQGQQLTDAGGLGGSCANRWICAAISPRPRPPHRCRGGRCRGCRGPIPGADGRTRRRCTPDPTRGIGADRRRLGRSGGADGADRRCRRRRVRRPGTGLKAQCGPLKWRIRVFTSMTKWHEDSLSVARQARGTTAAATVEGQKESCLWFRSESKDR